MTRIFQTTSRAALIAMLAASPAAVMAQDTNAENAADSAGEAAQEAGQAAEQAGEAAQNAAGEAAQETEQAAEQAGDAAQDAAGEAAQETEQAAEQAGDAADEAAQETEQAADSATTETTDTAGTGDAAESGEEQAQPVEGQITMQSDGTILGSDLMGATVYSSNDETVGNIDDIIVDPEGAAIEGVVIGVGGFLGIGQKLVALEMGSIRVVQEEGGTPRLVTDATQADLEAAPEFVSASEQQSAQDQATQQDAGGDMGGTGATGGMDSSGTAGGGMGGAGTAGGDAAGDAGTTGN